MDGTNTSVKDELAATIAKLHSKSMTFNLLHVLILVAAMASSLYTIHRILANHEKQMAVMQQREDQYQTESKKQAVENMKLDTENKRLQAEGTKIETQIVYRDKVVEREVAKVVDPDLSLQDVVDEAAKRLHVHPEIAGDKIAFPKIEVQGFIANKIALDGAVQDKIDLNKVVADQKTNIANLSYQYAQEQQLRKQSESLTAGYKEVAGSPGTKLAKIVRAAKVGGVILGVGALAYEAGRIRH